MSAIKTNGLSKYYGKSRGIIDVSMEVDEGEIFGFIGPNGAGKSTMIKTLLNFIFPTSGTATVLGLDCVAKSREIKRSTGYVPCEIRFYEDLTVEALIGYSNSFYKKADKAYTSGLMERFELEPGKKMGQLSSGNKKKVALAAALACKPKLLILDEPTNGLDPLMRQTLFTALHELKQQGCTVFLSSHNLDEVQTLCDRVAIIREGRIVDTKKLGDLSGRNVKKVTVYGSHMPNDIANDSMRIISRTEDSVVFQYEASDMNALVAKLAGLDIKDLLVEDIKLSDIFMSYYQ